MGTDDGDRPDRPESPLAPPPEGLEASVEQFQAGVDRTWRALRAAAENLGEPETFPELPNTETDAEGRTITYRPYERADFEPLVAMYDGFDPADRAQGTPPAGEAAVRSWLEDVLDGVNVVAVHEGGTPRSGHTDGRLVGHAMFVPDGTDRHEFAIFVDQPYQGAGVGTALARSGLGHAREQGIDYVWLSVSADEYGLQSWYNDLGFSTVNPMGMAHRMSRRL
jgi:ribosomal protein S18 acetylase RimI-like enzyme